MTTPIETTGHKRAMPDPSDKRAAIMRAAGDAVGSEALAKALGMSSRNLYKKMAGDGQVSDNLLQDVREVLERRRHAIGLVITGIRDELAK
ncbi:hypothetical protein [Sphingomonas parapaucimobilis]|uniref:Uncharacterized protein n=1 Tax=Sphingomonas parapaucimobilis NBRC 15100 TaxID=1219049 RepID=A0A0A1W6I8_9SPHN|nr:hypothetical protein [Sphingomonas parapaucimobilis]GAM00746.1 hypothetical protein SP5_035_01480 [Sphingomonas parapaucimobilis NBRC 15100]